MGQNLTFYPSAKMAMEASKETVAYVSVLQPLGVNKPYPPV